MDAASSRGVRDAGALLRRLVVLAALWWVLDEGRTDGWWFAPAIIAGALTIHLLLPPLESRWRWSAAGLFRFIPFFLAQSILGGWDVARRVFLREMPIDPSLLEYPSRLRNPTARLFFLHVISLLPGTLSADARGATITIHALTGREAALRAATRRLEARVADLFGEPAAPEPRA
jgi:multicomponent Na+:H+ antiporter subunit E